MGDALPILLNKANNFHSYPFIHILHSKTEFPKLHVYRIPPNTVIDQDHEGWVGDMGENIVVLNKLLLLTQPEFWSQIVFDKDIRIFLEKYLQNSPRTYEKNLMTADKDIIDIEQKLYQLVFMVYLRLSTHKNHLGENILEFSPEIFAHTIYEKYIFSPSVIYDICTLYGPSNKGLLKKMVENIMNMQHKYKVDFEDYTCDYIQIIQDISLGILNTSDNLKNGSYDLLNSPQAQLQQYLKTIFDQLYSLSVVSKIYEPTSSIILSQKFPTKLAWMHDFVMEPLKTKLKTNPSIASYIQIYGLGAQKFLKVIRSLSVSLFREILEATFPAIAKQHPEDPSAVNLQNIENHHLMTYVDLMLETLHYKEFMKIYDTTHPVLPDLNAIISATSSEEACEEDVRLAFLHSTLLAMNQDKKISAPSSKVLSEHPTLEGLRISDRPGSSHSFEVGDNLSTSDMPGTSGGSLGPSAANGNSSIDPVVASNVPKVRDLFPDMSIARIVECLEYYQNDPNTVINAILEENLPPHLCSEPAQRSGLSISNNIPMEFQKGYTPFLPSSSRATATTNIEREGNAITKRFLAERPVDWFNRDDDSDTSDQGLTLGNPTKTVLKKNLFKRDIDYEDEFDDTTYSDYSRIPIRNPNHFQHPSQTTQETQDGGDYVPFPTDQGRYGASKIDSHDFSRSHTKSNEHGFQDSRKNGGGPSTGTDPKSRDSPRGTSEAKGGDNVGALGKSGGNYYGRSATKGEDISSHRGKDGYGKSRVAVKNVDNSNFSNPNDTKGDDGRTTNKFIPPNNSSSQNGGPGRSHVTPPHRHIPNDGPLQGMDSRGINDPSSSSTPPHRLNRQYNYKEKNKSHVANHDRKSRATQKMSKGMF